eukprot:COSAG02_NODE_5769_length_4052_cov_13.591665_3_plen_637_part_00
MFLIAPLGLLWCTCDATSQQAVTPSFGFEHGVASGDPLSDRIILWTRITPQQQQQHGQQVDVRWELSRTQEFGIIDMSGIVHTDAEHDWTVKHDAADLQHSTPYWFRFMVNDHASPVGTFKLPPPEGHQLSSLQYAVFSCANWRFGYFNGYEDAAQRGLDFWIHLGDFYYEYGSTFYPLQHQAVREGLVPAHDAVTLADYRLRHSHYRRDASLQKLTAAAPLIAIWDDHEVANDQWANGAQNHDESEQDKYVTRKFSAAQAYREWMPVRGLDKDHPFSLHRSFGFGNLAQLFMMETRMESRTHNSHGSSDGVQLSDVPGKKGWVTQQLQKLIDKYELPPADWAGSELEDEVLQLKLVVDSFRNISTRAIVGADTIESLQAEATRSVRAGKTWQLFGQPQVMQDHHSGDWLAAIDIARTKGDESTAAFWNAAISNVTQWPFDSKQPRTFTSYAPDFAHRKNLNQAFPVTRELTRDTLVALAAGRYRVPREFDDWQSHLAERRHIASAIRRSGSENTIIYGGDSHSAWVGGIYDPMEPESIVAAEFDVMSLTSPSESLHLNYLPMDLLDAGVTANNVGLKWADLHDRGYMLVELNHEKQHVQFLSVGVEQHRLFSTQCLAAFEVVAGHHNAVNHASCV